MMFHVNSWVIEFVLGILLLLILWYLSFMTARRVYLRCKFEKGDKAKWIFIAGCVLLQIPFPAFIVFFFLAAFFQWA